MLDREEQPESRPGIQLPVLSGQLYVTWVLIAVNLAMSLLAQAMSLSFDTGGGGLNVLDLATALLAQIVSGSTSASALIELGAMKGSLIAGGEYWRLFTAMFLHFGWLHLALNCFGLYIFGQMIEGLYGRSRFIVIYTLAGLAGSVSSYAFNLSLSPYNSVGIGASGAVLGLLGATVAFFIRNREMLGEMGRRTLAGLIIVAGINLAFGFMTPGVDNLAHIGGFVGGLALGLAFTPTYRIAVDPFGFGVAVVDDNSLLKRLWAIPVAVAVLSAGVWLGNSNVPYP